MNTLDINQQKVLKTKALLKDIIKDPTPFTGDTVLKPALNSQGGLAKYINLKRSITSCSLNTLKNASEFLLDRGFTELDELRLNAKDAIEKTVVGNKASKSTRAGLKNTVDDLKYSLKIMRQSNFLLTTIIGELRSELKKMALSTNNRELKESEYNRINKKIEIELNHSLKELNDKLEVDL